MVQRSRHPLDSRPQTRRAHCHHPQHHLQCRSRQERPRRHGLTLLGQNLRDWRLLGRLHHLGYRSRSLTATLHKRQQPLLPLVQVLGQL